MGRLRIEDIFSNPSGTVTLLDSWPSSDTAWISGGLLGKYDAAAMHYGWNALPWAKWGYYNNASYIDSEYVWFHSGSKVISQFLCRGRTQDGVPFVYEDEEGNIGVPNYQLALQLAMNPIVRFIPKWRDLWMDLLTVQSTNRLTSLWREETRTGTETTTTDYGKVSTLGGTDVSTKEQTDSTTETPSGSNVLSITGTITDKSTPTGSDKTVRTGKYTDDSAGTTAVYGYGYNTASGTDDPGKKNQRNGSEAHNIREYTDLTDTTTPGVTTTNDRTYSDYQETQTRGQKTDTSYHSSIADDIKYGKTDTASGTDTVTRIPNIVISHTGRDNSPVILLEELMEKADVYNFFHRVVFPDLDKIYTVATY